MKDVKRHTAVRYEKGADVHIKYIGYLTLAQAGEKTSKDPEYEKGPALYHR